MKATFFKSAGLVATIAIATASFAATSGSKGRSVGAGLSFPSSHQALHVNSSTLAEVDGMSMQGLWDFQNEEPAVTLVGSQKSFGWGLGWMDNGTTNRYDAGIGINLGGMLVGANLYTSDFEGLNGDVTTTIDLTKFRVALGFRAIDNGLDRFNAGVGFNVNKLLISLDMYKNLPWDRDDLYGLDTSVAYNGGTVGFGLGYDFYYLNGLGDGDLHADLSLTVTKSVALEGHYRLTPGYDSSIPDFSAGARILF